MSNFEVAASKFNIDRHSTSTNSKGQSENLKKVSWDNPVSPIDAKNSIGFFVQLFLGQPGALGDSVYSRILSAQTVENSNSLFNVSYTCYKS